jgi:signal transduction histidine kinase
MVRHAHAQHVRVELRQEGEDQFSLRICDDGIGFDVHAVQEQAATGASLGMLGMQERAQLVGGQLTIRSTPHGGTEIRARFPLQGEK